ncbi:MAG: YfhO family protein, partial [Acidobacteria bacterium]|nr:YfhO family protein [Acidobacteriota bacterium]
MITSHPLIRRMLDSRVTPYLIFAIATFAFMPQSLLGQASTGGIDVLEGWTPYMENLDGPPHVENPIQGDQTESIPRIVNFYDGVRDGRVQQWEPNVAGGTPLATMPFDGIWSPLNWSHTVLPHWYATSLRAAFAIFIAQVGTFLFLRRLGIGRSAATIGAIGFGFSGATLVFLQRVTVVFVFPLLMHAVERVLQRRSPGTVAWLATTIAWCWIEGFPTGFVYALVVAGAWSMLQLGGDLVAGENDLPETLRLSYSLLAGVLWGFAISAFVLIPFLAQLDGSGLRESRQFDEDSHLSALESFGLFDTSVYGPLDATRNWLGTSNAASATTVGLIMMTVAAGTLIATVSGRIRLTRPACYAVGFASLTAMVVFVLVYLGGPLLALAYEIPGLGDGNLGRTRFLLGFAFSIVAAVGIDALLRTDSTEASPPPTALRIVSGGLLALLTTTFAWYLPSFVSKLSALEDPAELTGPLMKSLALGLAATLIVTALGYSCRHAKVGRPLAVAVMIILVWLQLALPMRSFTPQAPIDDFYP